ncbi:hypothetical protein GCM10007385_38970 [Tateyamaria omphalii]|uniref:flavodoxin family protein n=1 Tax=Tateyamaria omphalii TaxID=299262 RepID=UPI001673A8CD|nr:hypothetical protein [Tateyamaria omphalii]GGX65986.1 hypothetical protein GCM10007385_38970 [Tateyamaria omphalii]
MSATKPPAIYCYSKSGTTRHVAKALAQSTGAEVVPIDATRYNFPLLWMFRAIWDVGRANVLPLDFGSGILAKRPWIVVAAPIWADQLAPPGRTVLRELAASDIPVGVLTTSGRASEQPKCFSTCEAVLGRALAAQLNVQSRTVDTPDMTCKLAQFAEGLGQRHVSAVSDVVG